jgi:hypothetical protein
MPASKPSDCLTNIKQRQGRFSPAQFDLAVSRMVALADNGHSAVYKGSLSRRNNRLPCRFYHFSECDEQSELWMDHLDYSCDTRVSFSLLTDSQHDGASPWDVVARVLQVVGATDRLMMYVAEGRSKRHQFGRMAADEVPVFAPELSRSCVLTQHGIDIDRQTIVARAIGEESHPRLGLALILLEAQRESIVAKMLMCLGLRRGIRKLDTALLCQRSLRPQDVRGKHQQADP